MSSDALPWLRDMLNHASRDGSRSTALKPVGWMTSILASSSVASTAFGGEVWLTVIFGVGAALSICLYLFAYIFLLFKDRDALRSETYSIQRLAIEKGVFGDSATGVIDVEVTPSPTLLLGPSAEDSEDRNDS